MNSPVVAELSGYKTGLQIAHLFTWGKYNLPLGDQQGQTPRTTALVFSIPQVALGGAGGKEPPALFYNWHSSPSIEFHT